jgi:hypothetical protein
MIADTGTPTAGVVRPQRHLVLPQEDAMTYSHAPALSHDTTPDLSKRLDDIGWGFFLLLTGILWLIPEAKVPPGTWLIGTGLLLLGLNAVRMAIREPVSRFTLTLGGLALLAGLSALWGLHLPLAAICLILFGGGLLARHLFR